MASILSKPIGGQVLGQLFEEVDTVKNHELGLTVHCDDGTVYMYVIAGEAITGQGYLCQVDASADAEMFDDTSGAMAPQTIGVCAANSDVANNEYFWICIKKPASNTTLGVVTLVSCGADVGIYSTTTPGAVDDVATNKVLVTGMRLLTATPTTATVMNVNSEWTYPHVSEA